MISSYLRLLLVSALILLECHGFFRDYSSWIGSSSRGRHSSGSYSLFIFRSRGTTENVTTGKGGSIRRKKLNKGSPSTENPDTTSSTAIDSQFNHILEKMDSEEDPNKLADILIKAMTISQKPKKQASPVTVQPPNPKAEFTRVVNIEQIPRKRSILCKLLVKEHEKASVAKRFNVPQILHFSANVTMTWRDTHSLLISGSVEGQIGYGNNEILAPDTITTQFETLLLNNINTNDVLRFEDEKEYDDEIKADGNIDIAEIACQYFEMEI
eukprot:gene13275-14581_t